MAKPVLKLDWCSAKAARYACEHWHYSKTMPSAGVKIGVWEDQHFMGSVLYGIGAGNCTRGDQYGLAKHNDIAELMRVALSGKQSTPTSRILSISIKMIARQSPDLKMLISFADEMSQGHYGIIYQASNWIYAGVFEGDGGFWVNGKTWHSRSIHSAGWVQSVDWLRKHIDPDCHKMPTRKHRYLYPLTQEIRTRILHLSQPYPKRAGSVDSGTTCNQQEGGGATPTPALDRQAVAV